MSERLSVALLSHLASREAPTGAERSLALLAEALGARGHRVAVATPGPWALAATLAGRGVEVRAVRCRCCWLAYHDPRSMARALLGWARCALPDGGGRRMAAFLRRVRPDVTVVNCLPHVRGAAAAHALGIPVVWYLREILPPGRRRRWFAARLRRHARTVVAVSEAVGDWVREEGLAERLVVIPNGVAAPGALADASIARRRLGLPTDGCLVGLWGQIRPHKGVLEFVKAGRLALRDEPGLRFALAGPGPQGYLRRVRREIAAGPGADRFHLLPPQPSAEDFMAAADAIGLASVAPDPLPRSILEAMACGRPVAAFRSGGAAEMVLEGRTGLLAPAGDLAGLAAALVRLGRDAALRRELGAAGARRAREFFSIERHVERVERVLRQAADR